MLRGLLGSGKPASSAMQIDVFIANAEHLPKTDVIGSIDSYVKLEEKLCGPISVSSGKGETTVKKNSYAPIWNEIIHLTIKNDSAPGNLVFAIMDWNRLEAHELVGLVTITEPDLILILEKENGFEVPLVIPVMKNGKVVCGHDNIDCVLNIKVKVISGGKTKSAPAPKLGASPPVPVEDSPTSARGDGGEEALKQEVQKLKDRVRELEATAARDNANAQDRISELESALGRERVRAQELRTANDEMRREQHGRSGTVAAELAAVKEERDQLHARLQEALLAARSGDPAARDLGAANPQAAELIAKIKTAFEGRRETLKQLQTMEQKVAQALALIRSTAANSEAPPASASGRPAAVPPTGA